MEATRPAYWNIAGYQAMWLVVAVLVAVLACGVRRHWLRWRKATPLARPDEIALRVRQVMAQAVAQRRLLRDRGAGLAHPALSWGFALLFAGTVVAALDADLGLPVMRGSFYLWFQSLTLDAAGLAASAGLAILLWRRYVARVPRLREPPGRGAPLLDGLLPAGLLVVLLTGFVLEGLRIAVTEDPWGAWSPAGRALAAALRHAGSVPVLRGIHAGVWWFHLVVACALIGAIPYTKLAHVVAAPLNIFFAPIAGRSGDLALRPIDFEGTAPIGLSAAEGLTRKQVLDLESCTECGRCQATCPAFDAGQPLSPKALVLDLHDHARGLPPRPQVNLPVGAPRPLPGDGLPPLISAATPEAIWSCLTCGACVEACPVGVQHVPTIVEMRRHLVMEAATYPEKLQAAMANLEARGTPYVGMSVSRTAWTRGLEVPRMAERGKADVLYWVGCAAAFDERGQKVARAIATVLGRAGVDFAILGDEESCTGDAARRVGDELLFTTCAQRVIETLGRYKFEAIVTGCAHCLNTLKNEYPALGGRWRVLHHTELLRDLLRAGRLAARRPMEALVTYHDPCYLGRYNGGYAAPREVLRAIPGLRLREMQRSREASFCCGAGGGQNFTREVSGGRVSHRRADQVLATGARAVATACPFCAPMLKDGLAVRGPQGGPQVLDVAEIVEIATRVPGEAETAPQAAQGSSRPTA